MIYKKQIGEDVVLRGAGEWPFAMFRMFGEEDEAERHSIEFQAWFVRGVHEPSGALLFGHGFDGLDDTTPREENRLLSGFIKFDGCMQGHWDDVQFGFHFDYKDDIDELRDILIAIRSKCMGLIGETDE
jgi:hypothetical protein